MIANRMIFSLSALALMNVDIAHAGGLFIPGVGSQAMGRGGAFVAKADDPSALHHNPAGFARVRGTQVHLGSNLIDMSLSFTRTGVYEESEDEALPYAGQPYPTVENEGRPSVGIGSMQALPLVAVGTDLGGAVPGLHIGFGVMVPNAYPVRDMGGNYEFEAPGVAPPPTRYDVVEQDGVTVLPSLALAYSLGDVLGIGDKLDIGVRFSWGFANIKAVTYTWAVPNFSEYVGADGRFELDVSDRFVPGYGVGMLYRPTDNIEIGAAYSSKLDIRAKGTGFTILGATAADPLGGGTVDRIVPRDRDIRCGPGGTPEALSVCLNLSLPRTATLGARFVFQRDKRGRERGDIELDVKWEDWSSASDYTLQVDAESEVTGISVQDSLLLHNLQDVLSVRLGGSYSLPLGDNLLTFRAGAAHDTAAAEDAWQRLDIDGASRSTFTLGAAFQASRFRIDIAGGLVVEPDRTVDACNPANSLEGCPAGSEPLPAGEQHTAPDPLQPLVHPALQSESPFNGGEYSSGYLMMSVGVTTWF